MDDTISRQAAVDEIARRDTTDGTIKIYSGREVIEILNDLPSAQHDLEEMIVICDNCGHAIHIKIEDARSSEVARDIATIIENERNMRVIAQTKPPSRIERELNGKPPEEQCRILRWLVLDYSKCFTDSYAALTEWLKGGNDERE